MPGRVNWKELVERDDSPLERARLFARLIKDGHEPEEVAAKFGCAERTVVDKARIARSTRLSVEVKAMWDLGDLTMGTVMGILAQAHNKGLPIGDQIRLAQKAEAKRVAYVAKPRLLKTDRAVHAAKKRKREVDWHKPLTSSKPGVLPKVDQVRVAEVPIPPEAWLLAPGQETAPILGGAVDGWDVLEVLEHARGVDPDVKLRATPMNGNQLSGYEMYLLGLLRHWHEGIRKQAAQLLPRLTQEQVDSLPEERPQYTVVPHALVQFEGRLVRLNFTEAEKRQLVLEYAARLARRNGSGDQPPEFTAIVDVGRSNKAKYGGSTRAS